MSKNNSIRLQQQKSQNPNNQSTLSQKRSQNVGNSSVSSQSVNRTNREEMESSFRDNEEFYQLVKLTQANDYSAIKEMLKQNKTIDILNIIDSKGYTLLHKSVLNQAIELLELFLKYGEQIEATRQTKQIHIKENISKWINLQTEDGYTTLHFASFKGNLKIMDFLMKQGADMKLSNKIGLNVMHLAGQGDQPKSLAYFYEKGLELLTYDNKKTTPLHWASYLNSENAVNYLVSGNWNVPINLKDSDGLTPLHLAVISGNSKIVRKLLIKGADRNQIDQTGNRPIDLAVDNEFFNIEHMLKEKNTLAQACKVKPGFKPQHKSVQQLLIFAFLYLTGFSIFTVFYFPIIQQGYMISFSVINGLTLLFFFIVWLHDPGYLPNNKGNTKLLLKIMQNHEASKICPECYIVKPDKSRHCELCKQCISHFDHHCNWINNCVGSKNHGIFLSYILLMWVNLIVLISFTLMHIGHNYKGINNSTFPWLNGFKDEQLMQILAITFSVLNLIMSGFFLSTLSFLVYIQINNFLLNKTTFERFSAKQSMRASESSIQQSSIDSSSILDQKPNTIKQSLIDNSELLESQVKVQTYNPRNKQSKNCKNIVNMCCQNQEDFLFEEGSDEINQNNDVDQNTNIKNNNDSKNHINNTSNNNNNNQYQILNGTDKNTQDTEEP